MVSQTCQVEVMGATHGVDMIMNCLNKRYTSRTEIITLYIHYNMTDNSLLFADDAVIFAPSAKGLQHLVDICSKFALTHDVAFNAVNMVTTLQTT